MDYLARQKIETAVIAAFYALPALYSSIVHDTNLAIAIGLAVLSYVATAGFLTLLRTDDMPDSYGSKWDYPPLLIVWVIFLVALISLSSS